MACVTSVFAGAYLKKNDVVQTKNKKEKLSEQLFYPLVLPLVSKYWLRLEDPLKIGEGHQMRCTLPIPDTGLN